MATKASWVYPLGQDAARTLCVLAIEEFTYTEEYPGPELVHEPHERMPLWRRDPTRTLLIDGVTLCGDEALVAAAIILANPIEQMELDAAIAYRVRWL